MKKTLAIIITGLLLSWGTFSFVSQVAKIAPLTGIEWVDSPRGVVAESVIPRTPGWRGGLRPGDRLSSIDSQPVISALGAEDTPWRVQPGGWLTYRVVRDGEAAEF
ncbi:MAG TPA: PDZ domain-containing protein, partial [Candidatus Polarisedimenticolia bacterium]